MSPNATLDSNICDDLPSGVETATQNAPRLYNLARTACCELAEAVAELEDRFGSEYAEDFDLDSIGEF